LLQRREQVGMAVAGDRFAWRLKRDGLVSGQRLGLGDVEDRHGLEERSHVLLVLAVGRRAVLRRAVANGHGGKDPDAALALAHAPPEVLPSVKARDEAGVWGLQRDEQLVVQGVASEPVAGPDLDPAPPAVA